MTGKMQWNFPRGNGRKVGKRLEAKHVFTDSQRLDWLLSAEPRAEVDGIGHFISVWLPESKAPDGVAGYFVTRGASHRECIDKFLRGDITRVD